MAKAKQDVVKVVNLKNRTYNGVRHLETVEIPQHELVSYLAAGFEVAKVPEAAEEESSKASRKSAQTAAEPEAPQEPEEVPQTAAEPETSVEVSGEIDLPEDAA